MPLSTVFFYVYISESPKKQGLKLSQNRTYLSKLTENNPHSLMPQRDPYAERRTFQQPSFHILQNRQQRNPPSRLPPPIEIYAPFLELSFICLSNSLVYESLSGSPTVPYEERCPFIELFRHPSWSPIKQPFLKIPLQGSISRAFKNFALNFPGKPAPPVSPNGAPM